MRNVNDGRGAARGQGLKRANQPGHFPMDAASPADDPHVAGRAVGACDDGSWDVGRDKERGGSGREAERGGAVEDGDQDSILDIDLGGIVGTTLDFGKVRAV